MGSNKGTTNGSGQGRKGSRILQACDACRARKIKVWIPDLCYLTTRLSGSPDRPAILLSPSLTCDLHDSSLLFEFASGPLVLSILDPWFEHIHPVVPIFHRRRLLHRIEAQEVHWNPEFRGVILSICAATVASLPRRDLGSISAQEYIDYIDQHGLTRGGFERCSYTLDWCVSMYNIAVAMTCISTSHITMARAYHALSEALAGVRYLEFFCMETMDELDQQLLIRLFWVLFAASCSTHLFGKLPIGLFSSDELIKSPRPLPLADRELAPSLYATSHSDPPAWHGDDISYIPGLNSVSDLYISWHSAQSVSECCDADPSAHVAAHMAMIECIMNDLPPELRWRGGLSRPSTATDGHDMQLANIFITSLHIRSNLLRRFGAHGGGHNGQYEAILNDLSQILLHLPDATFNANGSSLIPKIRDIAAAYLEQGDPKGSSPVESAFTVDERVLGILRRLDELDCWKNILFIAHP